MTHNPLIHSNRPAVLLAEDDPDQSEMLADILDGEGYTVETAFSGEAALHKLMNREYELVLLDIRMPGMYGSEVLRRFRTKEKDARTAIIVLSAFATEPEMQQHRRDGANLSLSKPYDFEELIAAIEKFVGPRKGATSCSQ